MPVHPTTHRGLAATTIIASLAFAGVASAAEPTITRVDGNPTCASLGAGLHSLKIDPVPQGHTVFGNGTLSGSIDVRGSYFSWTATPGADVVIVKGGPAANVYKGDDELTSGTGYHAPANGEKGRPYGLSHIDFCSDGVDSQPRPPAAAPGGSGSRPDQPSEPGTPAATPGDSAAAPTATTPGGTQSGQGEVLGTHASGGRTAVDSAQMSGSSRCAAPALHPVVRGRGITSVRFVVNGRHVRTFRGNRGRYTITVNPNSFADGLMRIEARVRFVRSTGRLAQRLRMTVLSCAAGAAGAPSFAG